MLVKDERSSVNASKPLGREAGGISREQGKYENSLS